MMKILVTGSNGLLGQKLTRLMGEDQGITLIATARTRSVLPLPDGHFFRMDITSAQEVDAVVRATRPDVVIHTAAMTQVDQCELEPESCWLTNVTAVEHIVHACKAYNARLIHLSTDFIFDGSHGPLDENEVPNPVNYYGKSKVAAEVLVQQSGIDWCIIRTVLVYGLTRDMSRSNIVLWVKQNLEAGKKIQVVADQFRTPTLAEDLALGCVLAARKNGRGVYHISGKDFLSPYDIAVATAEYFNLDKTLIEKTDHSKFTQPARRPPITGFVIEKARRELGFEPRTFQEGIKVLATQLATPALA